MNRRSDFPLLASHEPALAYLDSASSTQKPQAVIEAVAQYYAQDNANVHRGLYQLSQRATEAYDRARETVREFIGAKESAEIIFTKGTTEAMNLLAHSMGLAYLKPGDEIIVSVMEHHANIVPWQVVCERIGCVMRVIELTPEGELNLAQYADYLSEKTRIVSIGHVSNALGTQHPIEQMIDMAHAHGAFFILDAAQSVAHLPIDVQALDVDFLAFSGHKLYGPMGIGVLYGKRAYLDAMPPYQTGGDMIRTVSFEKTEYNHLPDRFEAGTPNVPGAIGLAAAIDYVREIGFEAIKAHDQQLMAEAVDRLSHEAGVELVLPTKNQVGALSFVMPAVHPHDIGTILDTEDIAIRAGHHCAMPLMQYLALPATARVSFGLYNTVADIDALVRGLHRVKAVFHV